MSDKNLDDILIEFDNHYDVVSLSVDENGLYDYSNLGIKYKYDHFIVASRIIRAYFNKHGIILKKSINRHGMQNFIFKRYAIFTTARQPNKELFMHEFSEYEGPHIPILCSFNNSSNSVLELGEMIKKVVVPTFVVHSRTLPYYKLWRWFPCSEIRYVDLIHILLNEEKHGGWMLGPLNKPLIPYKTGKMY